MEDTTLTRNTIDNAAKEQDAIDKQPLVSFIVPHYNTPVEWLKDCVNSILALSLSDDEREIIIVDDGSATNLENDPSVCQKGIRYIRQANGGLSSARNTGIDNATGRYIQFVDDDDRLAVAEYDKCVDILRERDTDILLFDFQDGRGRKHIKKTQGCIDGSSYMLHNNIMPMAWRYVFKRTLLNGLRFTEGIYHEDEDFTPQLIVNAHKLIATDLRAYIYCKREGSIMTSRDINKIMKRLDDKRKVISRLTEVSNDYPTQAKAALQRRIAQLTMDYIYNVIVDTRSAEQLSSRIDSLRRDNLFPLPKHRYTTKYLLFRQINKSTIGRWLMLKTLPLFSK